ncbi:MAG: glycosyltransferase family 4 protein [Desulfobaccales bacterium]
MRVAVLSPAAELGGAERSLLTFLKAAQGHLVEATVLLPREGPMGPALTACGVPWEVMTLPRAVSQMSRLPGSPAPQWSLTDLVEGLQYAARLRRKLNSLDPDIIYTNGIKSHVMAALLRPWVKGRLVWHLRDFWAGCYAGLLADWGPRAIIANSRATAASLQKRLHHPEKVTVVLNAVDPGEFSPRGPLPEPGPWTGFSPRVGLVAAYARWKGHSLFIEAARFIAREFPAAGFFIIGGDIYDSGGEKDYEKHLTHLARRADLENQVLFTGFQAEVAPWYRALDVVVNASLKPEPFGRTLLEAMACGRAVVGPRAGGVPEFISHGDNGLLYEMGSEEGLATAILTLLRSPGIKERLGNAGRETACRSFSPEVHAALITQVFRQALS